LSLNQGDRDRMITRDDRDHLRKTDGVATKEENLARRKGDEGLWERGSRESDSLGEEMRCARREMKNGFCEKRQDRIEERVSKQIAD